MIRKESDMGRLTVELLEIEERNIYGLWKKSNDKTISNDISFLSREYYEAVSRQEGTVLPFVVLSRDYDKRSRDLELLIGSTLRQENLECLTLPAGTYARMTVKPKWGRFWGMAIGEAKRYFYSRWLPGSGYEGLNLEYEYHTAQSSGQQPSIDIIFGVKNKEV